MTRFSCVTNGSREVFSLAVFRKHNIHKTPTKILTQVNNPLRPTVTLYSLRRVFREFTHYACKRDRKVHSSLKSGKKILPTPRENVNGKY